MLVARMHIHVPLQEQGVYYGASEMTTRYRP
jgi:hypothetical protein